MILSIINELVLRTAVTLVTCLEYLLMFRAIMSWFPQLQGGKLFAFLYGITEPIIMPSRKLMSNVRSLRGFPLDIPFMLAFIAVIFVEILLQNMLY